MSGMISVEDAYNLTLLLVAEPSARQLLDLHDGLNSLANQYGRNWILRRLSATDRVRKDLSVIIRLTRQLANLLSPTPSLLNGRASKQDVMRASILRDSLALQLRKIKIGGLLGGDEVIEGPDLQHDIVPLLLRLHEAARRARDDLAEQNDTTTTTSSAAAADSRRRRPEYDDLIAGAADLSRKLTGEAPRFSDRPAQLERPRELVSRFVEFVLKVLPLVGRALSEMKLELDDSDLRRLTSPTPDEIREAYRRVAARDDKNPPSPATSN
jgi:hypothetical protein